MTALIGFLLSFVIHIATVTGMDVMSLLVWVLHVGVLVVFVPFVLSSRKGLRSWASFEQVRNQFPGWVVALVLISLLTRFWTQLEVFT